jgi:hypothetical protein
MLIRDVTSCGQASGSACVQLEELRVLDLDVKIGNVHVSDVELVIGNLY